MVRALSAMPLVAVDAIVIDTETTGLDTRTARIVQVGGVRLDHGHLADEEFDTLVNPMVPIPPATTKVHGVGDADVQDAPKFPEIWPKLLDFQGGALIVGHSIGFDLAVLRRECERNGLAFDKPRSLDTRLLAQIANPELPGFSIEMVARWLSVDVSDRHTALGDARVTAALFLKLVPHLAAAGIRTVAEAEAACRQLTHVMEEHKRAGWIQPVSRPGEETADRTLGRIDPYAYRHRVRELMSAPPLAVDGAMTLGEAIRLMSERRISSLFVAAEGTSLGSLPADGTGVLTERDCMRAIAARGADALGDKVDALCSRPLIVIPEDAFVYRAIGRMSRRKVRHLAAISEDRRVTGALSARDLLRLRAGEAISLGDEIDEAGNERALARAWSRLPQVARGLKSEGLDGANVAGIIAREIGALTRQAAVLAERSLAEDGLGEAPCRYAVLVLGSAGRGESLLSADQDNAIVFEHGEEGGGEDRWFAELGRRMSTMLTAVGLPNWRGAVTAEHARWRGSMKTWLHRIDAWSRCSDPGTLDALELFFDLRSVHGDGQLARELAEEAYRRASNVPAFASCLAKVAGEPEAVLTLFGGFKAVNGRLDLKTHVVMPIVALSRAAAVSRRTIRRGTRERLDSMRALEMGDGFNLGALADLHALCLDLILDQQLEDIEAGVPVTNAVLTKRFGEEAAASLKKGLARLANRRSLEQVLIVSS
ncbi:MAG: CBS domain-containing protein [Hyphomicrobiaceae bacterium]|nr:CBS domain-containing protein [Hyphomicrobiaceae bacterium]